MTVSSELLSSQSGLSMPLLAIVGVILVNILFDFFYNKYQEHKLGCEPGIFLRFDNFFGFKSFFQLFKIKKEGRLLELTKSRFEPEDGPEIYTFKARRVGVVTAATRDPENIKAILATQFNDFALGRRHAAFFPLLGDGIFTLDGTGWKHSRALLRPQFAREQVAHVRALEPHILRFAKHVKLHQGGKFDIQELFFRLTVDSATEFLFGESVESLKDSAIGESYDAIDFDGKANFAEAFNTSQAYSSIRAAAFGLRFLFNTKRFKESNAVVHKFAEHYVNKALNTETKELEEHSKNGYIFLYELVQQTRDRKVLRDQLLNILVAGRDTTAGLLSFAFYELSRNPAIWEKLKAELYETFGSGDDSNLEDITFESLKKCEYLKAVLNETLRMYPSVPSNFRVATRPTSLPRGGGPDGLSPIYIPKGTTVSYCVYATHRNKSVYGKDANDFRPERWFEPSTKKLGWNFVPFNGGPRICLGQQFALTEASYVITRLAQMFPNLKSMDDGPYPPTKKNQLTMSLRDGAWIALW